MSVEHALIGTLVGLIGWIMVRHHVERRDLLNRLMAKNLSDLAVFENSTKKVKMLEKKELETGIEL